MDPIDFLLGLVIGLVLIVLPTILIVDTNNYNHKPCDWFVQNNYSVGNIPVRCKDVTN